ncbi:hypothetical protein BKA82DRAFT_790580 [Pisolithus tinctorius]|uniref:Uncharacterized protein n=1 Tax=Pisolithus tinctorius Marx 270 TaxID=870435 RepID=A0A0C3PCR5_PISTI|nr:hypothetical protein BKA82DRAFT_790580 [Pisolithus tinctorius]KIO11575.1 hypothetical protein M404DRAFT_790580 [Pisolithus tinctorius Marx 270]
MQYPLHLCAVGMYGTEGIRVEFERKVFCWQQVDYNSCNISFDVRDGGLKRPQQSANKIRTYSGGSCSQERVSIPGCTLAEEALGCFPHVLQVIRCPSATGSPRKRTRWLSGARRTHNRVAGCPKRYLWDKGNYFTIIEAEAEHFGYDKRLDGELQSQPAPHPTLEIWVLRPVPPLAKYLFICILSPRAESSTLCSLIQRTHPLITWVFKSAYFLPCPKESLSIILRLHSRDLHAPGLHVHPRPATSDRNIVGCCTCVNSNHV